MVITWQLRAMDVDCNKLVSAWRKKKTNDWSKQVQLLHGPSHLQWLKSFQRLVILAYIILLLVPLS